MAPRVAKSVRGMFGGGGPLSNATTGAVGDTAMAAYVANLKLSKVAPLGRNGRLSCSPLMGRTRMGVS